MIHADHRKWADFIFKFYLNRLFKHHFHAIHLMGPVPQFDKQKPILMLPNHSTWWDGFFFYLLNKNVYKRKMFLMMLEEQLEKNKFFRRLGAFSVNGGSVKELRAFLKYTTEVLNNSIEPVLMCIFPQGELQPWNTRPLKFKRGLELILNIINSKVTLCYLGIKVEFLNEQRPDVFLEISPEIEFDKKNLLLIKNLETSFNLFINQMEKKIVNGERGSVIIQGKKSVNQTFEDFWKKGARL